eukprot:1168167-Alexandrium_andersonii.AAC.1
MDIIGREERAAALRARARIVEEGGRADRVKLKPRAHPKVPTGSWGRCKPSTSGAPEPHAQHTHS